ncbi:hypothetical protein JCM3775_000220 [Rhodotorula graminis]
MPPAPGLTFKGPAHPKRTSKPVVLLDPVVPRGATKKRHPSSSRDDSPRRSPDKAARRATAREDGGDEDEASAKEKHKGKTAEAKGDNKAPTKRVKAAPVEQDDNDDSGPHVPQEERVSRDTVAKRWHLVSTSTRAELLERARSATEDVLEEVFADQAGHKSAHVARKALKAFTNEFDAALASLAVPPLPSNLPQALKGKGKDKGDRVDLCKKSMQDKLEAAQGDADDLDLEIEKERKLLKRDKARLAHSS